jgi:hypothetical protein
MDAPTACVRVIVHATNGSGICRDVCVASLGDLLAAVAQAVREASAHDGAETCAYVVVQHVSPKASSEQNDVLAPGAIEIINICGRVTHAYARGCVVTDECQPLMTKSRDSFGLRTGIFTVFGNFMTSESNKTTLFRGAKRCRDVLMVTEYIFKTESIDTIVMHMLVAKSRLPHAVLVDGPQFEHSLCASGRWLLTAVSLCEDMSYMKPLQLQMNDGRSTSIRLHIYSSGVVFFFVTCPDTPLSEAEERRVVQQCGEIYTCLASVC